jgi:hypothetical protein
VRLPVLLDRYQTRLHPPKNFVPLNLMMERAGMSEMDIYNRTRDVFLHYKLPCNSEPPEKQ